MNAFFRIALLIAAIATLIQAAYYATTQMGAVHSSPSFLLGAVVTALAIAIGKQVLPKTN